jgi:serine/threonine protein kinase
LRLYDPIATAVQPNIDVLLAKRSTPHLYLSPEECEQLEEECTLTTNTYKSDVWTLGMILLEAGLAQYQDECYRDEYSRIHWETLSFNLNRFAQLYSSELTTLLQLMLTRE